MKRPVPTQTESPYGFDEFFFSTTNKRGVILFGNDVFVRVSAYPKETMMGAPHSLIRHPDMPRAVFKEFWNFLNAGRPVGAYVKNLAGNGSYYWVYAFAFPIADGYLSVRFKPSSEVFTVVQALYADVLEFEKQGHSLEESHQYLLTKIQEAGFPDYETFMAKAVMEELKARAAHALEGEAGPGVVGAEASSIAEVTQNSTKKLRAVFAKLREFQGANTSLDEAIGRLDEGFQQLKFISINMKIAAAKFGDMAASLGVVSHEFSVLSGTIEKHLQGLSGFVGDLSGVIQKCILRSAALNIQMLMVDFFVRESIAKMQSADNAFEEMLQNQQAFSELFALYCRNLDAEFSELKKSLSAISSEMQDVSKFVTGLEVIRQMGAIESSRTSEIRSSFTHYLQAMDQFIQLLRGCTGEIGRGVSTLSANSDFIVASIRSISGNVDQVFNLASDPKVQKAA